MALIEINRNPSQRELKWFGAMFAFFFAIVGALVYWRANSPAAALAIWGAAALIVVVYYGVPRLRRLIYVAWLYAALPIGWTVSHGALGLIYCSVLTPIGVTMRLLGRDPMSRGFDLSAGSYWVEHDPVSHPARYLRQF